MMNCLNRIKSVFSKSFELVITLVKWLVMGTVTGTIVGAAATAFALCLTFVNQFRAGHGWVIWLLPFAGLLIVFLYRYFRNTHDTGTNMVIETIHSGTTVSYKMAPLIFISTVLTHLCGGSSGREGAAIQLGGSISDFLSHIPVFRFSDADRRLNVMCGVSAGFSALFGTPMAAAIFALEAVSVGMMQYSALVPCLLAAFTGRFISAAFGVHAEAFTVGLIPAFGPLNLLRLLLFGVVTALLSILFCVVLHTAEHLYKKIFPNTYVRIGAGGCLVLLATVLLGTRAYLGSGVGIIEEIFETGEAAGYQVFLLKMLFTALTLGAGYKGGEIVPSFTIGAAFGSLAAAWMGLPVPLVAACGMVGVFCGVTNCPITSLLIAFEMFGMEGMPYYLFTIAASYAFSGDYGLYHQQRLLYSKTRMQFSAPQAD